MEQRVPGPAPWRKMRGLLPPGTPGTVLPVEPWQARGRGEEAGAANSGRVWPDDGFGPAYLENPWRRKRAPNRDSLLVHRLPQIDVLRRPFSTVPPARDRPSAPSSLLLARPRRSEPSRFSLPRVSFSPSVDLLGPP